ncbi:DUF397 domain-containing protein [Streptomyces sp. JV176]|uniref:DUF397 domain-containing protein n=1 Tax=Streptomyces sp. JV176 TaxID=858630 RepID=UPI002E79394B|nr:DUF397 domain-containing protein [Streptomyces sp. JV176]MEE1803847.1 DUF397 domain-containing protein [Streptomyces sp. JV176]
MTREPSTGNPTDPQWFKSSYSGSNDNDCVEVCAAPHAAVLVRDSKAIDRPTSAPPPRRGPPSWRSRPDAYVKSAPWWTEGRTCDRASSRRMPSVRRCGLRLMVIVGGEGEGGRVPIKIDGH